MFLFTNLLASDPGTRRDRPPRRRRSPHHARPVEDLPIARAWLRELLLLQTQRHRAPASLQILGLLGGLERVHPAHLPSIGTSVAELRLCGDRLRRQISSQSNLRNEIARVANDWLTRATRATAASEPLPANVAVRFLEELDSLEHAARWLPEESAKVVLCLDFFRANCGRFLAAIRYAREVLAAMHPDLPIERQELARTARKFTWLLDAADPVDECECFLE